MILQGCKQNVFDKPKAVGFAKTSSVVAAQQRTDIKKSESVAARQSHACMNYAEARMPKASRTEAALSPKGRGADSGGESEAAKGGCEETNVSIKP